MINNIRIIIMGIFLMIVVIVGLILFKMEMYISGSLQFVIAMLGLLHIELINIYKEIKEQKR